MVEIKVSWKGPLNFYELVLASDISDAVVRTELGGESRENLSQRLKRIRVAGIYRRRELLGMHRGDRDDSGRRGAIVESFIRVASPMPSTPKIPDCYGNSGNA